jgi:hypothetical protein
MTEHEEEVRRGIEAATTCLKHKFPTASIRVSPGIDGSYTFHLRIPGRGEQVLRLGEDLLADYRTEDAMQEALAGRSALNRLAAGETDVRAG